MELSGEETANSGNITNFLFYKTLLRRFQICINLRKYNNWVCLRLVFVVIRYNAIHVYRAHKLGILIVLLS